jgi:hypothetical protein
MNLDRLSLNPSSVASPTATFTVAHLGLCQSSLFKILKERLLVIRVGKIIFILGLYPYPCDAAAVEAETLGFRTA